MIYYSVIEQRRDEAIPNILDDPQTVVLSYESKAIIKDGKICEEGIRTLSISAFHVQRWAICSTSCCGGVVGALRLIGGRKASHARLITLENMLTL